MKKCKFSLLAAAVMAASFAFADADDLRVVFSTQGPDLYADGSEAVKDEWYALAWLADEDTALAVDTQLNAVDATKSEVLLAAPLATENHNCPPVLFLLDSAKKKESGIYRVYMLDTRGKGGTPAAADATGKPVRVNSVQATTAQAAATAGTASISVSNKELDTSVAAAETDASNIANPKIESFNPYGDNVLIEVSGMVPSVNYVVKKGADLGSITATDVVLDDTQNNVVIPVDKGDAKFFSIGRKPIK